MNYIKSFFSQTPEQQAKTNVEKYLSSVQINTKNQALPLIFQFHLNNSINQSSSPTLYMKSLVDKLTLTKNVSSMVKLFTIIHNAVYERDYKKEELEGIEDIPQPIIENQQQKTWFTEFATNYCNYLRKLPSVCDIYERAKGGKVKEQNKAIFLQQVCRIINQVGTLFPSICNITNIIGRYYLTSYPEIPEFYRMLNKELLMVYSYMKTIIDEILSNYRMFDVSQLKCFMKTIPQIELTCDKMEDLLLNKYFKGKAIKAKIYFKEEKVQEICYFLQYQLQGKQLDSNNDQNTH